MSPITHGLIGWTIATPLERKRDRLLVTIASVVSDIDGITLLGGVELYHEYHHTFGHNVFLGLLFSAAATVRSPEKFLVFSLALLSFHSHLLCDLLGSGADWGIFYLWPFSRLEITSFPPFQWELDSWQNLVTTMVFLSVVGMIGIRKGRTIVELYSENADRTLVSVLRKWAGR